MVPHYVRGIQKKCKTFWLRMLVLIFIHKWIWRIFIKQINAYTIDREISFNSVDFYFSICLPLIFLSLLIAPASTQQLSERNIEKERAMTSVDCFGFLPFRMMLIVSFSLVVFIVLRNVPSWPAIYGTVIMKVYWILAKALASLEMIMWFISLFIYVVNFIYWLRYFEPSLPLCNYKHLGHGGLCFRAVSVFSLLVTLRISFESLFPVCHEPIGCSPQPSSEHLLQRTTLMFSNVSN